MAVPGLIALVGPVEALEKQNQQQLPGVGGPQCIAACGEEVHEQALPEPQERHGLLP